MSGKDSALLPPRDNDVTFLGAARMPIEAIAEFLPGAPPDQVISTFTSVGVKDFIYGDYALDTDVRMEVRAAEFSFSDQQQATNWINTVVGSANLDTNGLFAGYSDVAGLYYAIFTSGAHGAMLFCSATVSGEAASRACEGPLGRVINSWRSTLASS
jgi:hypothetical protein